MVNFMKVMIDEKSLEFLRSMKNKELSKLLAGIYNFFDLKFTQKGFNINPIISANCYHMEYKGVDYSFNFSPENNLYFRLIAKLKEHDSDLEKRIEQNRVNNKQLDETTYLADQRISSNTKSVNVYCRIKTIPGNDREINDLCGQLWGYIIKNVFKGIHEF